MLTDEDRKILTNLGLQIKGKFGRVEEHTKRDLVVDFSDFNTLDDVKTKYDEIQKFLSVLAESRDSNANKAMIEIYGLFSDGLAQILKTDTARESIQKSTQQGVSSSTVEELERKKAEETEKLVQALKNEREQREIARQSSQVYDFKK